MQVSSFPSIEELVPHTRSMRLVDDVVALDTEKGEITVSAVIRKEWCENWATIELMAQAAAALVGAVDIANGRTAKDKPGLLLGTRKLEMHVDSLKPGETYLIDAKTVLADGDAASFSCAVRDKAGAIIATATLNAYRPSDPSAFMAAFQPPAAQPA